MVGKRTTPPWVKAALAALGGAALFVLVFFLIHLPHGPEHWSADLRTALFAKMLDRQHDRIALIEITDATLAPYPYVSPTDRKLLADLIRAVDASAPKAIGLDVIFDRPSEPAKDELLRRTIRESHAPIVLGALDSATLPAPARDFQSAFLKDVQRDGVRVGHLYLGEEHRDPLIVSEHVIRKIAMPSASEGDRLSFAEVLAGLDGPHHVDEGREIFWVLPPGTNWWSRLRGSRSETDTFLTLPAEQVLAHATSGLPLERLLGDKFVLIGGNFSDRDQHLTPLSVLSDDRFTGLFIHAQILAQLLADAHIYELGVTYYALLAVVAAAGVWTGRREELHHGHLWIEFISVAVLVAISILCFVFGRFIFPFVSVLVVWLAGMAAGHFSKPAAQAHEPAGGR